MPDQARRSRMIRKASRLPPGGPARRKILAALKGNQIGYGPEALKLSWQGDFPETVPCVKCGKDSRHVLTVMEGGEEDAADLHHNDWKDGEFWFHDYAAFSLYMCPDIDCTTVTTKWNQG